MVRRFLVADGAGFMGSNFVRYLLKVYNCYMAICLYGDFYD